MRIIGHSDLFLTASSVALRRSKNYEMKEEKRRWNDLYIMPF